MRDLVDQIKQITIEIRDIKERKKTKVYSTSTDYNTINVRNHSPSGSLQGGHEGHDEDDVHYEDSTRIDLQLLGNKNNQAHCAPTQSLPAKGSTSLHPLPPEDHPSLPSNENPSTPPSTTPPWSTSPDGPKSPEIEGGNVDGDEENVLPSRTMVRSSGDRFGGKPDAECKKEGV